MSRYTSRDGLCSSGDPSVVAGWDAIGAQMADDQRRASAALREMGVKAEHPDDGWVNRERDSVQFVYPAFDDGVQVGDLIALGWPFREYRIVRCTAVTHRRGPLLETTHYSFGDDGERWSLQSDRRGVSGD